MQSVEAGGLGIGDKYPPRVMGVLNVSPESPYDPSVVADPERAATYVEEELLAEGADIIDVGLESANKRFETLSAAEELDRLDTAIDVVESVSSSTVFSIETRYSEVAESALSRGFDMVNDVCGFADREMPAVCTEYDAAVVKMASPPDLDRPGAIESVEGIYDALAQGGLTEKTILDPAFGGWSAGKSTAVDRETFERLREFRGLGRPLLVSINRKNFLREIADRSTDDALPVSLAATSMAVARGAHVIRTHDVRETRDAALLGRAFARDRTQQEGRADRELRIEELDVERPLDAKRHLDRIGAEADPEATVARVVEIGGLGAEGRDRLAELVGPTGATLATGADAGSQRRERDRSAERGNTWNGGQRALLFGTIASLRRVVTAIENRDRTAEELSTVAAGLRATID
ncbi:dihydropteroate synthase [Halobacteriales archaeon QS_3_64_16]|nr:MAG: dihydropteroate synthase [Halobacteriales archaeon QS_3_64_16]